MAKNKSNKSNELRVIKGKKKKIKNIIIVSSIALLLSLSIILLEFLTPTGIYEYIQNAYALTVDSSDNNMVDPDATVTNFDSKGDAAFLLTNSYFEIFNKKGNNVLYFKHGFSNPSMDISDSRVLIFDRGGKKYKVFNYSSVLYESTIENNIISADIAKNGKLAFVTSSNSHASQLKVLDKNNKEIFVWNSDKVLSAVTFKKDSSFVAISGLYTESGILSSSLTVIDASKGIPVFSIDFYGEVISSIIEYSNKIIAASDSNIYVVDWKTEEYFSIKTDGIISFLFKDNSNQLVLIYSRRDMQTLNNIIIYNKKFECLTELTVNAVLTDVITDDKNVYTVYDNKMCVYSFNGELIETVTNEANIQRVTFVSNKILACGTSKIIVIKEF